MPDLAFSSDPNYGVIICQAAAGGCPAPFMFGGTSFAAPALAAATAVMNHAAGIRLGQLNPQIYPLAGTSAFHTPAELGSDFSHVGLGSPVFNTLLLRLTGRVAGAVSASQSQVKAISDRVAANGTANTRVVVYLRDAEGNMIVGKTVSLSQSAGGTAVITPPSSVTTAANGVAIFDVKNASVQNVTFTATDVTDGVVLTQTPVVNFDVPPATAGGIGAFPTTVANNGTATTTITVTLQDAQGNPTPGKRVALSQGSGHSIITAPSPAVTDAGGQIQFIATNRIAEVVTYTAMVETDGIVPVHGNAVVTFSGQASVACAGAITAAPNFEISTFATGFLAEAFSYSNINFGCAGATDPTFDATGHFYVSSYRTGELFRLPPQGGAATTANRLSTPGLTLQRTVFGKDGKLYAVRSASGSDFFSGAGARARPPNRRHTANARIEPSLHQPDGRRSALRRSFLHRAMLRGRRRRREAVPREQSRQSDPGGVHVCDAARNAERGRGVRAGWNLVRRDHLRRGDAAGGAADRHEPASAADDDHRTGRELRLLGQRRAKPCPAAPSNR